MALLSRRNAAVFRSKPVWRASGGLKRRYGISPSIVALSGAVQGCDVWRKSQLEVRGFGTLSKEKCIAGCRCESPILLLSHSTPEEMIQPHETGKDSNRESPALSLRCFPARC